jgi:ribose 5-phosphate isomerase B
VVIAIGCDPNALEVKSNLKSLIERLGHTVVDFGSDDPIYAKTAFSVAQFVSQKKADRGILLCGTGIGVSISANKVKGAYAALISDAYSAERSIKSNNANIACFSAFTLGSKLIETLTEIWLKCEYTPGTRSEVKINEYVNYDKNR